MRDPTPPGGPDQGPTDPLDPERVATLKHAFSAYLDAVVADRWEAATSPRQHLHNAGFEVFYRPRRDAVDGDWISMRPR